MKRFLLPLIAITIAGLLLPTGVRSAYACSCAILLEDEQIRSVIDSYDVVVIAAMSTPSPQDRRPDKVHVDVETVYKGPAASRLTLDQSQDSAERLGVPGDSLANLGADCSFTLMGEPGERYLLFLRQVEDDVYAPGGCASYPLGWITGSPDIESYLEGVERVSGGGWLPRTGAAPPMAASDDSVPWLAIAGGSSLATALVAASVFLLHRRVIGRD